MNAARTTNCYTINICTFLGPRLITFSFYKKINKYAQRIIMSMKIYLNIIVYCAVVSEVSV